MSIESKIDDLIAALDRNTAALGGKAVEAAPAKPAKAKAAPAAAPAPAATPAPEKNLDEPAKVDMKKLADDITALAEIVQGDKPVGRDKAVAILIELGANAAKPRMTDVPDARKGELHNKVKAALAQFAVPAAAPSLI